jgi:hypothetical protein
MFILRAVFLAGHVKFKFAHLLDGMHEPTNFLCHFPLELILFANESRVRTTARIGTRHRDGRRVGVMSVSIRRSMSS